MKKTGIMLFYYLVIGLLFFSKDTYPRNKDHTEQANYIPLRYVVGSGGVMGASDGKHLHLATAGEELVGGASSSHNFMFSGFWNTIKLISTEVEPPKDEREIPLVFQLHQNYPNPFNPQTSIEYDLPLDCQVTIEIFNLMGQRIRLLVNARRQSAGFKRVEWNGRDDQGNLVGAGIYLYNILVRQGGKSIHYQQSKKMLFIK